MKLGNAGEACRCDFTGRAIRDAVTAFERVFESSCSWTVFRIVSIRPMSNYNPTMSSNLNFWIVAWSLMGAAFLAAAVGIIVGAKMLDRQVPDSPDAKDFEP